MSEEEINKIIAEYMGWYMRKTVHTKTEGTWYIWTNKNSLNEVVLKRDTIFRDYIKSLDYLVPAVEKLQDDGVYVVFRGSNWILGNKREKGFNSLALATACAKVIKELGE